MKHIKFKSLNRQLIASFIALIITICIGISCVSIYISRLAIANTIKTTLPEFARQASYGIENKINTRLEALETLAQNEKLKSVSVPINEKMAILFKEQKRKEYLEINYVDAKGNLTTIDHKTFNISDEVGFNKAMEGVRNISDPIISKTDGSNLVLYTVPIENNGKIIGCLSATKNGDEISNYTKEIKFGKTGQAFMINKSGLMIANNNQDLVTEKYNVLEKATQDVKLKDFAEIQKKMIAGNNEAGIYEYDGSIQYIGYAPIKGTTWSMGIAIEANEVLKELQTLKIGIMLSGLLFMVLGICIIRMVSKSITKPIIACMEQVKVIADRDLTHETSQVILSRRDELGRMALSIEAMRKAMIEILNDIKTSSSNIDVQNQGLNKLSKEIFSFSENISEVTDNVAQGTSDQAQDLIDITSILQEFNVKLNGIFEVVQDVDINTNTIKSMANTSSEDMESVIGSAENVYSAFKELIIRMEDVGNNVAKINAITNLINHISEQTNLLALNAAIEAARAGEVGKGFSVVAEEIRKLAEQSKSSVTNISDLISHISNDTNLMVKTTEIMRNELENQDKNIHTAMGSFKTIIKAVDNMAPEIENTTSSIEKLQGNKENILIKIQASSAVAEEVAASSEEIAASTQQMNRRSENLKESLECLDNMSKDMIEHVNKFTV